MEECNLSLGYAKKHHYTSVTLPFLCSCIRRLDLAMMVYDDTAGYVDR